MCGVGCVSEFRNWRCGAFALIVLAPALGGCSSSLSMLPSMPSVPTSVTSMFGSNKTASNANASATTGLGTLPTDFEGPDVTVRQGASTLTNSSNPSEPTATNLRYQVTIGTTARECRLEPGNMLSIKVGMEGRVILGPEGAPGTINVPIRFAVVEDGIDPKTIVTKLDRVPVTVPPNDGNVLFSHVTDGLVFPMPKGAAIDSYIVYIGFDAFAADENKKPAPKAKPKPKKKVS
jgi:hypothetical protein